MKTSQELWSPLHPNNNGSITIDELDRAVLMKAQRVLGFYSYHPQIYRFASKGLLFIGLASALVFFYGKFFTFTIDPSWQIEGIFASFAPWWILMRSFDSDTNIVSYLRVAQRNNWVYMPIGPPETFMSMMQAYPGVFDRGDRNHKLRSQFWGIPAVTPSLIKSPDYFWMANYTNQSGSGEYSVLESSTVYAFPSKRVVDGGFSLVNNIHSRGISTNSFTKQKTDIQTESGAFNKAFTITYSGEKNIIGPLIYKTLTPNFQENLVRFINGPGIANTIISIGFYSGVTLISVMETMPTPPYKETLHPVTEESQSNIEIERSLSEIANICTELEIGSHFERIKPLTPKYVDPDEEENVATSRAVANAAYQGDGSFGTSPENGLLSVSITKYSSQIVGYTMGSMLLLFALTLLLSSIAGWFVAAVAIFILGYTAIRIRPNTGSTEIMSRQFKLFRDYLEFIPNGPLIPFTSIDQIVIDVDMSCGSCASIVHNVLIYCGQIIHKVSWITPSIPDNPIFDENLGLLLYYLGFRNEGGEHYVYSQRAAKDVGSRLKVNRPHLLNQRLHPLVIMLSLLVVGFILYLLWINVVIPITTS